MHFRFRPTRFSSLFVFSAFLFAALATCTLQAQLSGAVGSTSGTQTATVVITATGTSDATIPVYVLTQGAQNSDFKLVSGGTCAASTSYSTLGATCTVKYTFTPTHPGPRYGGITLVTSTGALLGNTYITGMGTGSQVTYTPPAQLALGGGIRYYLPPNGVAVDGKGDVYFGVDGQYNASIYEIPFGCTIASCVQSLSVPNYEVFAQVVDGSGNLFFTGSYFYGQEALTAVYELVAVGGVIPANATPVTILTGLLSPGGLAVDGQGNVYAGDGTNDTLQKVVAVNGVIPSGATPSLLYRDTTGAAFRGVAVSANGDVYFSISGGLRKISGSNGVLSVVIVPSGFYGGGALALDQAGNLYAVDIGTQTIVEFLAVNGTLPGTPSVVRYSNYSSVDGIALDADGNLYVAQYSIYGIGELNFSSPPTLNFPTATQDGSTDTTDGPQSFQMTNSGNEALTAVSPGFGGFTTGWFTQVAGSGTPADCTSSFSLAVGASCNVSIKFAPAVPAGQAVTDTFTLIDNNLNASPSATQTVNLNATAIPPQPSVTNLSPTTGPSAGGTPVTITGINLTGTSAVKFGTASATNVSVASSTQISATSPAGVGGSTVDVTVISYGATSVTSSADQFAYQLTPDIITVPGTVPSSVAYNSGTVAIGATSTSGQPVTYASMYLSVCSVDASGVVTTLSTGNCIVNVSQDAAGTYAAATTVAVHISVTAGVDTITVPGTVPTSAAYASGTISIGATSTSAQPVTYTSTTSGICSVTTPGGVVTLLSIGTCTVNVSQAAAGNFAAATIVPVNIAVTTAPNTITVPGTVPSTVAYGSGTVSIGATSTSTQPVTYTSTTTGVCSVTTPGGVVALLSVGTCTVNVSQDAAGNYAAATTVPVSLSVTAGTDTITVPGTVPSSVVYGSGTISLGAISTSGQPVAYTSTTTGVCTVTTPGGVVTILNIGTCTVHVSQAAAGNYAAATIVPVSIAVTAATDTISFPVLGTTVYGATPPAPAATSTSLQPVTYGSSTSSVCTATSSGVITILSIGTCTITANQAAAGNYASATQAQQSFTVTAAADVITVPGTVPSTITAADGPISIGATSTSGQPVTYTSTTPGVCSVTTPGGVITLLDIGTCTVNASQAAAGNYAAAALVPVNINVTTHPNAILFPALPNTAFGSTAPVPSATATSGQAITYGSATPASCTATTSGSITMLTTGLCTITANQLSVNNYDTATMVSQSFMITAGTLAIGTSSTTLTVPVTITTAGTLNAINVLTQGATGLDFNIVTPTITPAGGCVATTSYSVGDVCTVQYTFKPTQPFARFGGVSLSNASGNLLGNSYLLGTGTGSHAIFSTSTAGTLGGSFVNTSGVAIDASGNIYVADSTATSIKELVAVNGVVPANPTVRSLGSGFANPTGVAVDGSGNIFVADSTNSAVKEIVAVNGVVPASPASATIVQLGGPIGSPSGVAVDGNGNVFVGATIDHAVKEIPAGCLSSSCVLTLATVSNPQGVAVDDSGNVYVATLGSDSIKKLVAINGVVNPGSTPVSMGSGISSAYGVAVDGLGNVYATDTANNALKEILAADGSVVTLGSGYVLPQGIAVDTAGNVYEADSNGNAIKELSYAVAPSFNFSTPTTDGTTDTADGSKSFQIVNNGNAALTAVAPGIDGLTTGSFTQVAGTGTPVDCTATFSVAVGASCNVTIAFIPTPGTNGAVADAISLVDNSMNANPSAMQTVSLSGTGIPAIPVVTGISPSSGSVLGGTTVTITGSGFTGTTLVAFGNKAASNFTFVNDTTITAVYPGQTSGAVDVTVVTIANNVSATSSADLFTSIIPPSFSAGTEAVGTRSAKQTAYITITAAGTLSTISYLTQGAPGLDFNVVTGGAVAIDACTTTTAYTVGQVCSVKYTFTPTHPWLRAGGVLLKDASGNVLGQTYLSGTGTGPQVIYDSATLVPVGMGGNISSVSGIAVDGTGNVYVTDTNNRLVKEIPANCITSTCVFTLGSFTYPVGVAVDGLGNVYVTDLTNGISEFLAVNGAVPLGAAAHAKYSGNNVEPSGLAVDANGDIFFADFYKNQLDEVDASGTFQTLASGFNQPNGVAVDGNGNLYVADQGNGVVKKISGGTVTTVGSGFTSPVGVAVDGAGNVYVTDYSLYSVVKLVAVNGSLPANPVMTTVGPQMYGLYGVAVDAAGNIYATNYLSTTLQKLALGSAPNVVFATPTVAGHTDSTDGTQSFQIVNNGNATLTGTVPGPVSLTTGNFVKVAGNGTLADCASSFTLAQDAGCNVSLAFTPSTSAVPGPVTDTFTVVSNTLNASPSTTQTGTLSGTVTLAIPAVQFVTPSIGPLAGGASVTLSGSRFTNATSVTFGGVAATSFQIENDNIIVAVSPAEPAGTVDVVVTNDIGSSTTSAGDQFTYSASAISWNPDSAIVYNGDALGTGILNATDAAAGTITYSAEPLPGSSISSVTASSVLPQGLYLLIASFTPTGSSYPTTTAYVEIQVVINDVFVEGTAGMTHLGHSGNVINSAVTGGGIGASVDATGNVWSIDSTGAGISSFTSQGSLAASYTGIGLSGATALAIDGSSNIWITNSNNTVTELSNAGVVINTVTYPSVTAPTGVTIDVSGNVWIANGTGNSVSEILGGAAPAAPLSNAVTYGILGSSPGVRP